MFGKITLTVFLIIVFAFPGLALTLDEAVREALKHNPEIRAARDKLESARAAVQKHYFLEDPKIGLDYEKLSSGSVSPSNAEMKTVSFAQMIPFPAKLYYAGRAAGSRADMYSRALEAIQKKITKELKSAYYSLYKIEKIIELLNYDAGFLKQALEVSRSNYVTGKRLQIDVIKAEVELNRIENELKNTQNERRVFEKKINLLLNSTREAEFIIPELPGLELEMNYEKIAGLAINNSPNLAAEKAALAEADFEKMLGYLSYTPDLMLKFKRQEFGDLPGRKDLMFEASIPLWFPVRQNSLVASSALDFAAQQAKVEQLKNTLKFEVKDLTVQINNLSRTAKLYAAKFLPAYSALISSSLAGYRSGKISFIDVLDSERSYLELSTQYYTYLTQLYTRIAELEEIIGKESLKEALK